MSEIKAEVEEILLFKHDISLNNLYDVLSLSMSHHVDFADIYLQHYCEEEWYLEDGIVKDGSYSVDSGFGVRAISGDQVGFSHADSIDLNSLSLAAKQARSIALAGQSIVSPLVKSVQTLALYPNINPIESLSAPDKVNLLQRVDRMAKAKDARVSRVYARLNCSYDVVLVCNSEGILIPDVRPLVYFSVAVQVKHNGRIEKGQAGCGSRSDLGFISDQLVEQQVQKAIDQAIINLEAVAISAGAMPVVLGPGWPGVLLHEAVGHGLEGDFIRKKSSAFTELLGHQVASPLCTIVDDATLDGRRGSLNVDDEGTIGQNTVLIEKGVLKGFMYDRLNAQLQGAQSTGNGRRESYACLPLPRMTNTYMLPGESNPEEIIASVDRGLYAVDFAGGQVDITSGKFVFSMSEAYLIEGGKITAPVKGATLVGDGPSILKKVSMVGNDLALDSGIGTCGKDGQSIPVGVGQPTLKVDEITVGGSKG